MLSIHNCRPGIVLRSGTRARDGVGYGSRYIRRWLGTVGGEGLSQNRRV